MANKTNSSSSGGIGIVGLLGVVFIVLKLTGVIAWSWWWVLAPFWGGVAVAIVLMAVFAIVVSITHAVGKGSTRRRRQIRYGSF